MESSNFRFLRVPICQISAELASFPVAQDLGGSLPGDDEPVEFQESLFISCTPALVGIGVYIDLYNHSHSVLLSPCVIIFLTFFAIRSSLNLVGI